MPHLQKIGTEASNAGSADNVGGTKERVEGQFGSIGAPPEFSDYVGTFIGRTLTADEAEYVNDIPEGIKASIISATSDALRREVPIFVQWSPSYDYKATIHEATAGATSGGLIVRISGPYPSGGQAAS
jgi:hypothetical protein